MRAAELAMIAAADRTNLVRAPELLAPGPGSRPSVQHDQDQRRLTLTDTDSGLLLGSWQYAAGHGGAGGFIATTSITPASALTGEVRGL